MTRQVKSKYSPRKFFVSFHERRQRWAILVMHRRAGKTVAAVNDLIERATYNTREAPRYAYIAPMLKQAKAIAWEYLKRFAAPFDPKISESELYVELTLLPNKPRITIYGADNPDAFRGLYFDGVVLDEFGNMQESVWKEVLLPALVDRRGYAVFMGTPNGPNHFRDMWYARKGDDHWFTQLYTVNDTGIISQEELEEIQKIMDREEYQQEMMCNFEASVRGAIYARQVEEMIEEGRVTSVPPDPNSPTNAVMDLGFKDQATVGFFQQRFDGIALTHSHGDNLRKIDVYISYILAYWAGGKWKPDEFVPEIVRDGPRLQPGEIYLPHDAKARSLQTGKAIIDHFRKRNLRPKLVPKLDVIDGIAAVRTTFPEIWMDEEENVTLLLAMKTYHRKYDPDLKRYSDEPVHDWSSDWCDMLRYLCIMANKKVRAKIESKNRSKGVPQSLNEIVERARGGVNYAFCLDDLWGLKENHG